MQRMEVESRRHDLWAKWYNKILLWTARSDYTFEATRVLLLAADWYFSSLGSVLPHSGYSYREIHFDLFASQLRPIAIETASFPNVLCSGCPYTPHSWPHPNRLLHKHRAPRPRIVKTKTTSMKLFCLVRMAKSLWKKPDETWKIREDWKKNNRVQIEGLTICRVSPFRGG